MKVLIVTAPLPHGNGVAAARMAPLARQIQSLRDLGVEIDVLEVSGPAKLKYPLTLPKLWERSSRADLIHAHYGFCGWLGRFQLAKPVVVSLMGSDLLGRTAPGGDTPWRSRLEAWSTRKLVRFASAVIVKSSEMAQLIQHEDVQVIPNGVDTESFYPASRIAACEALGWDPENLRVLFPGNPREPRKGFSLAEAAVEVVRVQLGREVELVPLWQIPPPKIPVYMNAADALLMTSFAEGSPNVVKEAMACNLPVVSVGVGDVEWLLRGVQHSSVCGRDPIELAQALAPVIGHLRRSDGRDAIFRLTLDIRSVAQKIERVYQDVLKCGSQRRVAALTNRIGDQEKSL